MIEKLNISGYGPTLTEDKINEIIDYINNQEKDDILINPVVNKLLEEKSELLKYEQEQNNKLRVKIENLKCCGNCKIIYDKGCNKTDGDYRYCSDW